MDSENQNIELLNLAIKKLIEETKDNDDHQLLLSRLLTQVESLKEEQNALTRQSETLSEIIEEPKTKINNGDDINKEDEIVKEIKEVKRQNSITHWLLSTMIVLIVAWQISEVSLILKVKGLSDGLAHPFRSLGGVLRNIFKRPLANANGNAHQDDSDSSANIVPVHAPSLRIPELPHLELPDFTTSNE